ncbi:aconitase X swivel domain-containing protein [Chitinasiproducens palmae]|uniref:Predicted aconitase subunit 2 n=1 Tax=Chitinasiproducens palmae TaxID=1770053 RepID=A0A1H2PV65_9BURK|nr:DUF126 domain-containing protein [Chitinasiproducens palmae]SDV50727.1 predicted aconitase subunit 2 [Chitinasiproducens palmae]
MITLAVKTLVAGAFDGTSMVSTRPLSFFGDVEVQTGAIVTESSDLRGRRVSGRVLCLPFTHGSAGAWRVLQQLRTHGTAPLGIVVRDLPDPSVIQGAILAELPVLRLLVAADYDRLQEGARLCFDASSDMLRVN